MKKFVVGALLSIVFVGGCARLKIDTGQLTNQSDTQIEKEMLPKLSLITKKIEETEYVFLEIDATVVEKDYIIILPEDISLLNIDKQTLHSTSDLWVNKIAETRQELNEISELPISTKSLVAFSYNFDFPFFTIESGKAPIYLVSGYTGNSSHKLKQIDIKLTNQLDVENVYNISTASN